jgi:hypothetical protein
MSRQQWIAGAIGYILIAMRRPWQILLPVLAAAPAAASAELPVLFALDEQTKAAIQRALDYQGYPEDSTSTVEGAIIGAVQQPVQPVLVAYRFDNPAWPLVDARSRASGRCQQVEATIWLRDGSRPPIRLSGRYCEHGDPHYARIWRATSQRLRILDEDEALPPLVPPAGALVEGP